jgi:hypothetical protein
MLPAVIAHADWGASPEKRWMAVAVRLEDGKYLAEHTEQVCDTGRLLADLRKRAGGDGSVLAGFDFPIGVPTYYAKVAGIVDFLSWLPKLGSGVWQEFFEVAETPEQISPFRPFYPRRNYIRKPDQTRNQVRQRHLLDAIGATEMNQLRRLCEKEHPHRRAACPLFWTLGAQQVGKAAIAGWKEVLAPGLPDPELKLHIWPFSGLLRDILANDAIVTVETYPAEFYHQLGIAFGKPRQGEKSGKRVQAQRVNNAGKLLAGASQLGLDLEGKLKAEIEDGFGADQDGEDRFDAVVGLVGMLKTIRELDSFAEPENPDIQCIEGWIFGQSL